MKKKTCAFSLIELSIVVLIIGILIAGVTQGSRLVTQFRLTTARALTRSSPITSISGLQLWFEPTLETSFKNASNVYEVEDGDKISSWLNTNIMASSFVASQSTPAMQPTYKSNGINDLPTLFFDSDNAGTLGNSMVLNYDNAFNSANFTLFIVTEALEQTTNWGTIIMSRDATVSADRKGYNFYKDNVNVDWEFWTGNLSSWHFATTAVAFNRPFIFTLFRNSADMKLYQNNVLKQTTTSAFTSNNVANFFIGANAAAADIRPYDGYISEIIYYDRALKSEEMQSVNDYLAKKYNIR